MFQRVIGASICKTHGGRIAFHGMGHSALGGKLYGVVRFQARLNALAAQLEASSADAYLAWHPLSLLYLQGYGEDPGRRFMAFAVNKDGRKQMICPALARNQAERAGIDPIWSWSDGEDPLVLFRRLADEWGLKSAILAVDDETPAHMVLAMQKALPAALFQPGGSILGELTRTKDEAELDALRRAGKIADEAYLATLEHIRPGVSEIDIEERLGKEMAARGGKPTFACAATGANGAEPHHLSDTTQLKDGDVLVMDFGCTVDGYHSDITRCVSVGAASDEAKAVYEIVSRAHMAARATIREGVPAEQVDAAARGVITGAGYGEFFFHRTGHGIGLRIHEDPFIVAGNSRPLSPGECFSIEPGIYLKGRFGVRIENVVAATRDGHESMNADPSPTLVEVG